jgi:hypothetical protein
MECFCFFSCHHRRQILSWMHPLRRKPDKALLVIFPVIESLDSPVLMKMWDLEECSKLNNWIVIKLNTLFAAGVFINNLTSDLPALRPLSVMALMFLLPPAPRKIVRNGLTKGSARPQSMIDGTSMENIISSVFLAQDFGENVVKHLSHDHNYAEGHSTYQYSSMNDIGLTALMPSVKRDWPYTRTWDSNSSGEQFSLYYAKLFKSLVRESGASVIQQLRAPLEEAARAVEERGKQCIAAEIIAGLIRSGIS